jgi:hypothetical protein
MGGLRLSVTCNFTTKVLHMGALRLSVTENHTAKILQMGGLRLSVTSNCTTNVLQMRAYAFIYSIIPQQMFHKYGGGAYTFLLFRITQQTFYKWEAYACLSLVIARQTFYNWGALRFTVTCNCTTFYLKSHSKRSTVQIGGPLLSVVYNHTAKFWKRRALTYAPLRCLRNHTSVLQ